MTKEEAINGLKENLCSLCAYGSQNMDRCGIRVCDNRDYIKALEQQPSEDCPERAENRECQTESHCFEVKQKIIADLRKLDKIEQIFNNYDGSMPSMIKQFSELQKILEQK